MEQAYYDAFGKNNYTWDFYDPTKEFNRQSFQGYYYKPDEPEVGQATIEKQTYSAKLSEENPVIPEEIIQD